MNIPLRVFIGYDSREIEAYHVLASSILRHTSMPVSIAPVALHHLKAIYTRTRGPLESTEFSMSRFLVPYLSDYEGVSVFMDCDMLVMADLAELMAHQLLNIDKAVLCCQHDYAVTSTKKFLGHAQTPYPRKNWSSLMVFNNAKCRMLTPNYVNTATGLELHRFVWMNDELIGSLPLEWNWLVGELPYKPDAKNYHWTCGGPWMPGYENVEHAAKWLKERSLMRGAESEVAA